MRKCLENFVENTHPHTRFRTSETALGYRFTIHRKGLLKTSRRESQGRSSSRCKAPGQGFCTQPCKPCQGPSLNEMAVNILLFWSGIIVSCIFSTRKKNIPVGCCSVLMLDCSDHTPRVVANCVAARCGKKLAPLILVCQHTSGHCRSAFPADFVQEQLIQSKFKGIPATILAVIWGLSRMRQLDGEPPGRPRRACPQDVSSSSNGTAKKTMLNLWYFPPKLWLGPTGTSSSPVSNLTRGSAQVQVFNIHVQARPFEKI